MPTISSDSSFKQKEAWEKVVGGISIYLSSMFSQSLR